MPHVVVGGVSGFIFSLWLLGVFMNLVCPLFHVFVFLFYYCD